MNTTLLGFAGILQGFVRSMPAMHKIALEQAAQVVEDEAKRVLGTHDYGWPALSPATLAHKAADTPGLETGEMRDSIKHQVSSSEACIGSDHDRALWFELGTRNQPPRSFLAAALAHKGPEVAAIVGKAIVGRIATGPLGGSTGVMPTPYSSPSYPIL